MFRSPPWFLPGLFNFYCCLSHSCILRSDYTSSFWYFTRFWINLLHSYQSNAESSMAPVLAHQPEKKNVSHLHWKHTAFFKRQCNWHITWLSINMLDFLLSEKSYKMQNWHRSGYLLKGIILFLKGLNDYLSGSKANNTLWWWRMA